MKQSPATKHIAFMIGAFVVLLIGCSAPPATPTKNAVVISTFTAAPANSPVPSEVSSPTPAPNLGVAGHLPGLSAVNVTVGLEGQKFTCTAVKQIGGHYERVCRKGLPSETLFEVIIAGRESFLVDFIEASVRQAKEPDTKIAAEFLGSLAALRYDGAPQGDARAWVEDTIATLNGDPQEMTFGGVKYVLSGPPAALDLKMGEMP